MYPAIVTLRGIEDYFEEHNGKTLFDEIRLPEKVNKDILIPYIITRAGDFPVMIIDPDYIYNMTINFFDAWYDNFEKLADVMSAEYDPLENYNRKEEEFSAGSDARTSSTNTDAERTSAATTNGAGHSQSTDKISADDDQNSFVNRDQNTTDGNDSTASSGIVKDTGVVTDNEKKQRADQRSLHAFGNIGTMTSQQMLESEWNIRTEMNIYEFIADKYVNEFCVAIY